MSKTKQELIERLVDQDEMSVEEVLRYAKMSMGRLREEIKKQEARFAANARYWANRKCPKCGKLGCEQFDHLITTIDPWPATIFTSIPKTKSPDKLHDWNK